MVIAAPEGHLDAKYMIDLMLMHEVTGFLCTVPTLVREYVRELREREERTYLPMKSWGLGGESAPADLVRQMQEVRPVHCTVICLSIQLNYSAPIGA